MSSRTLEKAVERLESIHRPQRQRYVVWFHDKPLHGLPAERDPNVQYVHFRCDSPNWREQWERIPVKNRQSAGA